MCGQLTESPAEFTTEAVPVPVGDTSPVRAVETAIEVGEDHGIEPRLSEKPHAIVIKRGHLLPPFKCLECGEGERKDVRGIDLVDDVVHVRAAEDL